MSGPSAPPGGPPPGPATADDYDARAAARDPLALLVSLGAQYGEIVRCPNRYGQAYLYNHPEYVRHFLHSVNYERTKLLQIALGQGTLSSDGPMWRFKRRIVNPAFQLAKVRTFGALMADAADRMARQWAKGGVSEIDLDEEMMRLTLTIAVEALFSTDVSAHVDEVSRALTQVIEDLGALTSTLFAVPVSFDPGRRRRIDGALGTLDRVVFEIIEARRRHPEPRGDLLDLLLRAEDPETGEALDDRALRDEAVTMLVAGHETTATALTWAFALLAEHPEHEARFFAEIDALDTRPCEADLDRLPFTHGVLQESLRLYPPVWAIARRVLEGEQLGGYRIEGDSAAFICPFMLHRHPAFWPEPERFDPERHVGERAADIERYAFVPFARGPHMCAGKDFAIQEGVLILAILGRRFAFRPVRLGRPEPEPLVTLRVKGGLPVRLHPRQG